MVSSIFCFLTAFAITLVAIPSIIVVAGEKRLFDEPNERSSHITSTPSLGGIGIFAGVFMALSFWIPNDLYSDFKFVFCSLLVIFFIGMKDDLVPMSPGKKFMGQLIAAFIIVLFSDLNITNLHGTLGIYEVSERVSLVVSVFVIIAVVNAFNLIDGINGLSGGITLLVSLVLGIWFIGVDVQHFALFAFATAGAVTAFLRYNITPAKIFMGDTGSMLVGLICVILVMKLIKIHSILPWNHAFAFQQVVVVALGVLMLPIFDMTRVFTLRLIKGKSPFHPDKTHIHHLLIALGLSHMKATSLLLLTNILFIGLALVLQKYMRTIFAVSILFGVAMILSFWLHWLVKKKVIQSELKQKKSSLKIVKKRV